ncbi:hypothetical protein LSTR_LSTR015536 [Laodelphax striatellus]|uniref:Uncharacterized protein n=1 Tax=Laodelphax striatellus TaxID=195883 RepID=A0A482X8Y0_LAOST|nr:hypothetical protein LSTR_LSTR015536 [Laodelphax striatellus]
MLQDANISSLQSKLDNSIITIAQFLIAASCRIASNPIGIQQAWQVSQSHHQLPENESITKKLLHYCERLITNFGRHLVAVHCNEESVQEYLNTQEDNLKDKKRKRAEFANKLQKEDPGVVPPLCNSLKKCCEIVRSQTIKNPNLNQIQKNEIIVSLDGFDHLMKKEWSYEVSAIAEQSRKKRKVNKEDVLPDSEDIHNFWQFLEQQSISAVANLKSHVTAKNYDRLAKIVISQIIVLNRRRPGEIHTATLENYALLNSHENVGQEDETTLTEEKKNAKNLSIFYIAASKNRKKVPVLLTMEIKNSISTLIKCRENLQIRSHLLFPHPGDSNSYQSHDVLGELKKKANLNKPNFFTATGLRHHAATSSQLHTRDDTYTKRLAKFMGHDLQTHENYYEMPLPLIQKAKVGTRLLDMALKKTTNSDASSENTNVFEEIEKFNEITTTCADKVDGNVKQSSLSDTDYNPADLSSDLEIQVTPKKKFKKVR